MPAWLTHRHTDELLARLAEL